MKIVVNNSESLLCSTSECLSFASNERSSVRDLSSMPAGKYDENVLRDIVRPKA